MIIYPLPFRLIVEHYLNNAEMCVAVIVTAKYREMTIVRLCVTYFK